MGSAWNVILDLLIALSGALLLGLACEMLGVSSVVGYLAAGALVGPGGLRLISSDSAVQAIANVGVALLLFTTGLEFSRRRLARLGVAPLLGGATSIVVLMLVGTAAGVAVGVPWQASVVLGAGLSLGSTSVVLRVLKDRNDLDSLHGRAAAGILLLQDVALVPLVLLVTYLSGGGGSLASAIGAALVKSIVLVTAMVLFTSLVIPRLLHERVVARNRELPIILAITACIGASWAAHQLGLPPAMGAFLAGLLLSEGRFADQMRADVLPLKTLFMTVFFASVGLMVDLRWTLSHLGWVLLCGLAIVIVKTVITYLSIRPFRIGIVELMAAALAVSQVGEFSFVLANTAFGAKSAYTTLYQFVVSSTLVTLFATPLLVARSGPMARGLAKRLFPARRLAKSEREAHRTEGLTGHVVVVGYGEAGQCTASGLDEAGRRVLVVEVDPRLASLAEGHGYKCTLGDATQAPILERARVSDAATVVIAVPDHRVARLVISQCKALAPNVPLVVRSRYHAYAEELDMIGGDIVVDEENTVGHMLWQSALRLTAPPSAPADLDPYHSQR